MPNPRRKAGTRGLRTGRSTLLDNPPPHPPTRVRSGCRCWSQATLMTVEGGKLYEMQPYGLELEDDQVRRHLRVWYLHRGVNGRLRTLAVEDKGIETLQLYLHGATPEELALDLTTLERLVFPLNGGLVTKGRLQTIISQVKAMQGIL